MFTFTTYKGVVLPLDISNIDTDVIIPKQFLQRVNKNGLGKYLFYDWRFCIQNKLEINTDFILNKKIYKNATILLTRENFGCGSSREHAVWALLDYGFKVIIASSFSDIFYNNSFNNKLLLITLGKKIIDYLFHLVDSKRGISLNVNLKNNEIDIHKNKFFFEIDNFKRSYFLNNLDTIDLTLKFKDKIDFYEKNIPTFLLNRRKFTV